MTRKHAVAASATAVAALAACGTPSADLLVIEREGRLPGAALTMRIQDGGEITCNGDRTGTATSDQLIDARAMVRDLEGGQRKEEREQTEGPAEQNLRLPPGPGSNLTYEVRAQEGTVAFADTSRGQPPVFFRLAKLTRDLAQDACKLPR